MRKQQVYYSSPLDALIAVSKRLGLYESQQGMDSETFVDLYRKGQMPDDIAFVEWANDYQHYLALHQQVEQVLATPARRKLKSLELDTRGFRFNREEANER